MAMGPPDAAAILIFILLLGFSSPSQAAMKNSRTNLIPDGDFQDILYAPSMYNVKLEKKPLESVRSRERKFMTHVTSNGS